ncbi:hypothetical protein F5B22DRAFT_654805 [Xylaria bambusicola]|uniref:uncharacterized protein n=1 Tax=Xylaria bambusicola TaxID=326684 RepID=UPI00200754E0|nr:uncharacterized protein F5B22DRAFT_654805 [Xylaria bambusicola]KAI0517594.1 hypothetical protein F5B22DRAFT_654805 [Xylaria bambusicola]
MPMCGCTFTSPIQLFAPYNFPEISYTMKTMHRTLRYGRRAGHVNFLTSTCSLRYLPPSQCFQSLHKSFSSVSETQKRLPQLQASQPECSTQPQHVQTVSKILESTGVLKISLDFPDDDSQYLKQLVLSLHEYHGHRLPISHSASRGWFWDVRPSTSSTQTANYQARSETMEEFAWHTDCSYEDPPPRYFALQVLQPDRYGGGILSLMNVQRLSERLSSATRAALMLPEYRIATPPEFYKQNKQGHIIGGILSIDSDGRSVMRFRGDIISTLSSTSSQAVEDLKRSLLIAATDSEVTLHLSAEELPARSIVLVDNRRWLHARTDVKDPERHLRRIRWDPISFPGLAHETYTSTTEPSTSVLV